MKSFQSQADFSPSDDELIAYLLETGSQDVRIAIENWVAKDASHGERLCQFATTVLYASDNSAEWESSTACHELASVATDERSPQRLRLIVALVLAASILIAVLTIREFSTDRESNNRVALAWAESLPRSIDTAPLSDSSDWLLEQEPPFDDTQIEMPDDLPLNEQFDPSATFGFSASGPPDWLLAAVIEMQSKDSVIDSREIAQ